MAANAPISDDIATLLSLDAYARRYGITPTQALDLTIFDMTAAQIGGEYERRQAQFQRH